MVIELLVLQENQYTIQWIRQRITIGCRLMFAPRAADGPNEAEASGDKQAPWKPLGKPNCILVWRSRGGDVELWFDNLASLHAEYVGVDQQELQSENQQDNAGH